MSLMKTISISKMTSHSLAFYFVLSTLILFYVNVDSVDGLDYCAVNKFNSNSTWMQFTKEISNKEYAFSGTFKSLHCCTKGYRSIEWFKDNVPYPWPGTVSTFILYPESANQTVYSQTVVASDSGNYSCLVSNDTHRRRHTINFGAIDGESYSGIPLPTYEPQDQFVQLGEDARFFCEAFVGSIDLPDARSAVDWFLAGNQSSSIHKQRGVLKEDTTRDDKQIVGSYLLIRGVRREDLGRYTCRISNMDVQKLDMQVWLKETEIYHVLPPSRATSRRLLLFMGLLFLSALTLTVLYLRFALMLRLFCRDALFRPETDDGKQYDVLICYDERDSELVLGTLLRILETRYRYKCVAQSLSPPDCGTTWPTELSGLAGRSRRLVAVLSPALLHGQWTGGAIYHALTTFTEIHPQVVCVALAELPKLDHVKDLQGQSFPQLLRRAPALEWSCNSEHARQRFWTALRLRLPPRPRHPRPESPKQQMAQLAVVSANKKQRTARSNSHESLEVLV